MKILVTGCAGFIGYHLCNSLLDEGFEILGIDNLNDYYDVKLKEARLARLKSRNGFTFHLLDLTNYEKTLAILKKERPDRVIHLAAQAGVRYSLENPFAYINANIIGFMSILESARNLNVDHLVYASTSSVYGANTMMPFSTNHSANHPLTIYAASKKSNEMMAHSYSHLYGIPTTGLRFFTVYGPWGRPDMALFKFTQNILNRKPIEVFNHGEHTRDFTYVEDIAEGVIRVLDREPTGDPKWSGRTPNPASSSAPFRLYNIGSNRPQKLMRYIEALETALGSSADIKFLPLQPGDVPDTYADVDTLVEDVGFKPQTSIETGIVRFIEWYLDYYDIKL